MKQRPGRMVLIPVPHVPQKVAKRCPSMEHIVMAPIMHIYILAACANQHTVKKARKVNWADMSRNSGGLFINYGTNSIRGHDGG